MNLGGKGLCKVKRFESGPKLQVRKRTKEDEVFEKVYFL